MINNNLLRLKSLLQWIESEDKIADIGCDHGYLGIMALSKNVSFIQNIDNKKGPLETAIKNYSNINHNAEVIFSLSSGINNLDDRIDTICICGMGSDNIVQILSEHLERVKSLKKILLIPHKNPYIVRKFLSENQFRIVDEMIILENNKYYDAIWAMPDKSAPILGEEECLLGPCLMVNKPSLYIEKWEKRLINLNTIISSMGCTDKCTNLKREELIIKNNVRENNVERFSRKS